MYNKIYKKYIIKPLKYDKTGYFFEAPYVNNTFYENDYLKINPTMHKEDENDKFNTSLHAINIIESILQKPINDIADIGSGSTNILKRLIRHLQKNTSAMINGLAIDISASILSKSTKSNYIIKLRSDAKKLPVNSDAFDVVLMIDIIEHSDNPKDVISEGLRIGKYIIMKVPLELSLYTFIKGGRKRLKKMERKYGHINHFKREHILLMLPRNIRIIYEGYDKIPNRLGIINMFQKFLLKFKLYYIFRFLFGGFIILIIKKNDQF